MQAALQTYLPLLRVSSKVKTQVTVALPVSMARSGRSKFVPAPGDHIHTCGLIRRPLQVVSYLTIRVTSKVGLELYCRRLPSCHVGMMLPPWADDLRRVSSITRTDTCSTTVFTEENLAPATHVEI